MQLIGDFFGIGICGAIPARLGQRPGKKRDLAVRAKFSRLESM
jgi:hypothetical protein